MFVLGDYFLLINISLGLFFLLELNFFRINTFLHCYAMLELLNSLYFYLIQIKCCFKCILQREYSVTMKE